MKLSVTQENIDKALQNISRIASARTPLPILNNILLRTEKNRLFIAATNLEIAMTEYIGAKIDSEGSITIPARLLTDFIHNLPKGNITLEVKDTILHISTDHHTSTINGLGIDEFPELPIIDDKKSQILTLSNLEVKRVISQTIIASSNDTTRPMLTGVYFHTFKQHLYAVATDGYRLSECVVNSTTSDIQAIIPVATLQEVVRVLSDEIDDITVRIDENQARFKIGEIEITSKLVDATYVDYRQLIPKNSETSIIINKNEFLRITKIASLFARESAGGITLSASKEKQQLSIHSIASQLGENTSDTEAKISAGGSTTLNAKYLIDVLNVIEAENVEFSFNNKTSPCLIRSAEKNSNFQAVIMPLKS
jgi:DNA polymerase-3 subunit beta